MTQVYAVAAGLYRAAGWEGVLPLPAGRKADPPKGYTGYDGQYPTDDQITKWSEDRPDANIGLRLPDGVIGLDVDAYKAAGAESFATLVQRCGELPPTWTSTSKDDGVSGIRLYRVPPGSRFKGAPMAGIEVVQFHHRYAVVWPSVHPDGRVYGWIAPDGQTVEVIPQRDDLPDLPESWRKELAEPETDPQTDQRPPREHVSDGWAEHVVTAYGKAVADLMAGSRHDTATAAVMQLVRYESLGYPGAEEAIEALRLIFLTVLADDRPDEAEDEWDRLLTGAEDKVATTPATGKRYEDSAEGLRRSLCAMATVEPPASGDEDAGQAEAEPTPVERMRSRLLTIAQLRLRPRPEYLLDGIIAERSTGILFGPSSLFKSFLALAWSLCIAEGLNWEADGLYEVKAGNVVYVAGEGADGLPARVEAWEEYNAHEVGDAVLWYPGPINLMDRGTVETFGAAIEPHHPRLIWFDTLAKCSVGGDENSARDMGIMQDSMALLTRELECTTAAIHHTKKDGSAYRGSSSLKGDFDWLVEVKPADGGITVCSEKQKDGPDFPNISLTPHPVAQSLSLRALRLTTTGNDHTDALLGLLSQVSLIEAMSGTQLRVMAKEELKITRATFYRDLNVLVERGFVQNVGTKARGLYRITTMGSEVVRLRSLK